MTQPLPPRLSTVEALEDLRETGVIDSSYGEASQLAGGTTDAPVAIGRGAGPELVVKVDHPGVIWAAARFLYAYAGSPLVTPLRHVDARHRYLAYRYAPGVLTRDSAVSIDKGRALSSLASNLLCTYLPASAPMACWIDELHQPVDRQPHGRTWQGFLEMVLSRRHSQARAHLPEGAGDLALELAASPRRRGNGPLFLLHGDCGAHNFLFVEGHLSSVIDPRPVAGEPIHDLAAAFVSWPGALTLDTVLPAASALERSGRWSPQPSHSRRLLIEEVLIALYSWVAACARYIPEDVPVYSEAWDHWTALLGTR
jgi:hypothetical protein